MNKSTNNIFVLVWLYGNKAIPVYQGVISICQHKRSLLKKEPQYKQGKLLIRTLEGFKENPLWSGKKKKKV